MGGHVYHRINVRLVTFEIREQESSVSMTYEGDTWEIPEDDHETPPIHVEVTE